MNKEQVRVYMKGMFDYKPKSYQLSFAYDCLTKKRVIGVFCRQSGKSETTSKIAIIHSRLKPKINVLIFAPTDRQTGLIADKIRASIRKMPYLQHFHVVRETQREFLFNNGSTIICETTGDQGETVRGYTAHVIILEEAGSIKDSIIQNAILPMGATTDPTIIKIGTPRGKNHFFESSVDPNYAVHLYGWSFAVNEGLITMSYITEMQRTMPDITFRTEYSAEFIEDQDAFFSYELVENCKDSSLTWERYTPQTGKRYYMGADIARLGQDSTCLTIVEVDEKGSAKVVQLVEMQKTTLDQVIEKIEELMNYYKFSRVFVDETGLGAGVTDMLAKKHNQQRLQQGRAVTGFEKFNKYSDKVVGVKFSIQSKLDMYSNLKVTMANGKLKYPNHPKLIAQLRDFRYELTENQNVKLHHSEYGFDDFADSLALAIKEVNVARPVLIL